MHHIRRTVLFEPGRHAINVEYDDNHPDDRDQQNICFVLWLDDAPIGVVRLDRRPPDGGVVRLVGIAADRQRAGHGRVLSDLVDAAARERGMTHLVVNAAPTAIGFYEKTGWSPFGWDASELTGIAADCLQMRKNL